MDYVQQVKPTRFQGGRGSQVKKRDCRGREEVGKVRCMCTHTTHLVGIMPGFFTKLVSPNSLQGGLQSYTEPSKEATATTKSRRSGWRPGAPGSSAPDAAAHRAP
ncbi:hypothetical protein J1605_014470 [Eschrichtius robustus]|uniref:Uncharacterized protein n=1 Tax=Eschrichtius robustus TaxID=9764 RepID=A0AB34GCS4_ESCRO|nr:hypothetical protein J1605_014470 [Eschrichtius robustus]